MKSVASGMVLAAALAGQATGPSAADPFEDFGTAMKYGLPLAAAVCAADQDRLEDYAVRGLIQVVVVRGLKSWFDGTPIGTRPARASEVGRGFPSGHTAAAAFGAADLAGKCFPDDAAAGAAAYGAAGPDRREPDPRRPAHGAAGLGRWADRVQSRSGGFRDRDGGGKF